MDNASPPLSPPPSPAPPNPNAHRQWDMWCHITALSGLVVPFGNILGPLIIWQMKRQEFPSVEEHGKESLNFQLSALIYVLGGSVLAIFGVFFCVGILVVPVVIAIHFAAMILAIIAGIKANDGIFYRYPFNLRLIK